MKKSLDWENLLTIARQELRIVLRNRWIQVYAGVFALLALAVSYFGLAVIEFTGFQEFDRTAVSLVNMVLYLVPLAALLMAVPSFRSEGGAADQLFTQPVTLAEIVFGKLLGLSAAHLLATLLGFSFTGILIAAKAGNRGLGSYLALIGFTGLVGIVFLSLSSLLTVLSGRGSRAYAVVLLAWFGSVLLFDLIIIGVSFLLPESWANRAALAGVFLNPVDATRVAALFCIAGPEVFGAAGAQLHRLLGGPAQSVLLLLMVLGAWTLLPALLATRSLRRQDL